VTRLQQVALTLLAGVIVVATVAYGVLRLYSR
jgi:hypothetical protein